MNNDRKLNIGCGRASKDGYINLDSTELPGVDIIQDLNKYPWPFKDDAFEEVYCDNILEHLDNIIAPMEEIFRVLQKGGRVIIKVPIYPSIWAMADPTHKIFFTYMTFDCFSPTHEFNYYSKARFKIVKRKIIFKYFTPLTWLVNISELTQKIYYVFFSFLIPAYSLYFELVALK